MKQTFVLFLVFGSFYTFGQAPYSAIERYNDSILIYTTYQAQAEYLKTIKETDLSAWHAREALDDSLTACAKNRLRLFNNQSYTSSSIYENKGIGSVGLYPEPSEPSDPDHKNAALPEGKKRMYHIIDKQTRFFLNDKGSTVPYITRLWFHKGRLLINETEKLNPVTQEKL